MSPTALGQPKDKNFPDYIYTCKPLVPVYAGKTGSKKVANLFMGEWMKIIEKGGVLPAKGRVHVIYRGGRGYVRRGDFGWDRMLEVYFIDVSQGDAILIQTPDDRRVLIDGGQTDDAYEFICNKYRLDKDDNYIDFEAVVATHSDADHTEGLIKILEHKKIAVKRFYHNGLFRRTDQKQDPGPVKNGRVSALVDSPSVNAKPPLKDLMKRLVRAIKAARKNLPVVHQAVKGKPRWKGRMDLPPCGFVCKRLDATDEYLPPYTKDNRHLIVEVLWPHAVKANGKLTYRWYKDAGKTVNGNSIVLRLRHGTNTVLLTGDLNEPSMDDLIEFRPDLVSEVYKAAHHGSQHFSMKFLKAVVANAAVISSGDDRYDVHGHPRAVLMGTITRFARCERPAVFATELAACFRKLPEKDQKKFNAGQGQLYERAIQGIVHLRSDGKRLYLGTVFGRRPLDDPHAQQKWKWDVWPDPRAGK